MIYLCFRTITCKASYEIESDSINGGNKQHKARIRNERTDGRRNVWVGIKLNVCAKQDQNKRWDGLLNI